MEYGVYDTVYGDLIVLGNSIFYLLEGGRKPEDSAVVLSTSTLGFWSPVWLDTLEDQALALHSAPCRVSLEDIENSGFGIDGLGVG